jgi:MinD-like ATPase involved in chromosome partitioning or flagellar assembly
MLIAVTGTGGSGTSTVAVSLARHAASHAPAVLVDLTRHGGLRHRFGVGPVRPGITEIHGGAHLETCLVAVDRRLLLLPGQRDPSDWTTVTDPGPIASALEALRAGGPLVVCDLGPDLEGSERTGSLDVADRHLGARTAATRADAVLVVAAPHAEGLAHAATTVRDLMGCGVDLGRVGVVIARVPGRQARRTLRLRAQLLGASLAEWPPGEALVLAERRSLRRARSERGCVLPASDRRRLAAQVARLARYPGYDGPVELGGLLVAPGSLGFSPWPAA